MARVLITNDGSHTPEKWATVSAEVIFPIDAVTGEDRPLQAKKLQLAIAEALVPIYAEIQDGEWAALSESKDPAVRMAEAIDPALPTAAALKAVLKVAKGSPWADHFDRPEVQAAVCSEIASHLATIMQIERDWAVADGLVPAA